MVHFSRADEWFRSRSFQPDLESAPDQEEGDEDEEACSVANAERAGRHMVLPSNEEKPRLSLVNRQNLLRKYFHLTKRRIDNAFLRAVDTPNPLFRLLMTRLVHFTVAREKYAAGVGRASWRPARGC
jgi:hypothetical protein